jgi:hypothetical protein
MRKALRIGGIAVAGLLLCLGVGIVYYLRTAEPRVKARIEQALEERFDADVDIKNVRTTVWPSPSIVVDDIQIRHKQWTDQHPLLAMKRFRAATDFSTLLNRRNHVDQIRLEGLEIHIPPRGRSARKQGMGEKHGVESSEPGRDQTRLRFVIDKIFADGTLLEIEPKETGKPPLRFDIQKLELISVGPGRPMDFTAQLINPKPPGLIQTKGSFGPWQKDDPRSTAVSGKYKFDNADLSVFKGISGMLSSLGEYRGVLQRIEITGTTDTPDFALKQGGAGVHLTTQFHSIVDGTDGDTVLDPVKAHFLNSTFLCEGGIVHLPGPNGKTVSLNARTQGAQIEDILRLVTDTKEPLLLGPVDFRSKIVIPSGQQEVLDKLRLDGQFRISTARFSSKKVQGRLLTLSRRARGISKDEEQDLKNRQELISSDFRGRFKVADGVASFSELGFKVPGAWIRLAGKYDLRSEKIDMDGQFRMVARLSDTQSGVKHWLLKPLDPVFAKNGVGFEIPLSISGTRDEPEIGTVIFHKHFTIH